MIGVFDSGFGGLTVLRSLVARLPEYDYFYLGDSARAPYGGHSLEVVHNFTREAVECLFDAGCPLVVVACNTASAQALRTLQQRHLPIRRVHELEHGDGGEQQGVIGQRGEELRNQDGGHAA